MNCDELYPASLFEFEKVLKGKSNKLFYAKADVDAAIAELIDANEKCQDITQQCFKREVEFRKRIDELNTKNQNSKRELRATKRALWLARAERAKARKNYWYVRSCHEGDKDLWSIDGSVVKYIGCIKRSNFDWLKIWSEVECKCRAKAKEYK